MAGTAGGCMPGFYDYDLGYYNNGASGYSTYNTSKKQKHTSWRKQEVLPAIDDSHLYRSMPLFIQNVRLRGRPW